MKKLLAITALSLCTLPAFATNNTIFSCNTQNGTPVKIIKVGDDYEFTYGKTTFKNPAKQVLSSENSYIATGSSFITSSLELKNNGMRYVVEFVQPRGSKSVEEPTLYVFKGDKMDTVSCKTNGLVHNFEQHSMKP
ncbi:hypothetical protein BKG93_05935 [Rodentibacter ratti]|uniref:Adhesin n=2 Tax=Rodentibacter TaxID=1960084 RepID=A0A1V3L5R1_9PAST|nr:MULTISPECIES: hypothetical protein [Rodentibacter]OOF79679.1 hypothetical protein BKG96_01390 [Rodentibacter heylii]OOF84793.1 hypothetical protein BKG93_05935 [Rodentibacter ratti]QIA76777.1 hypothetical protein FEE42_05105 [Rodentibacter heylii]